VASHAFRLSPNADFIISVNPIKVVISAGDTLEMDVVEKFKNEWFEDAFIGDFMLLKPQVKLNRKFDYLKLGTWNSLKEGSVVYAAGFPRQTRERIISRGMASTNFKLIRDNIGKPETTIDAMWLDLTANSGQSGGPLLLKGKKLADDRVVGIMQAVYNPSGDSFRSAKEWYLKEYENLQDQAAEIIANTDQNTPEINAQLAQMKKEADMNRSFYNILLSLSQNSLGISCAVSLDNLAEKITTIK